jgi:GNAT superfamily N-acetyltransferase
VRSATQIEIRRAVREDAPARVLREAFFEFKPLYTDGSFAATTPGTEQIFIRMREGPVWVALREGTVFGTVSAIVNGDSVYVRGMAVLPTARGASIGAGLLKAVEDWAKSEGYLRLFLSTTPFLNSAIRLYEKSAYRRIEDSLHDLFGTSLFDGENCFEIVGRRSHASTVVVFWTARHIFLQQNLFRIRIDYRGRHVGGRVTFPIQSRPIPQHHDSERSFPGCAAHSMGT